HEQPAPSAVSSAAVTGARAGRHAARVVPALVALRSRDAASHCGGPGARALECDAVGRLAAGTAGVRAAPGGHPRAVLPRAMVGAAPAGRSRVLGGPRELA